MEPRLYISLVYLIYYCLQCFDTVGWAAGRHPACKKWGNGGGGHWLVRMEWHPAGWLVCLPLSSLAPQSPEVLFWHWLTRVVLEKGP